MIQDQLPWNFQNIHRVLMGMNQIIQSDKQVIK